MERFPSGGTIAPGSFPRLVADLHRHGATGSLKVHGPTHHKALYFRNGRILFGSSDDPRDQLGPILVAAGAVTEEQLRTEIIKVEPGKPLAQVLGDAGIVSQEALADAAQTKVERILADVLTHASGSFEFEDGVLPKGAVDLHLSTPRLFLAAARAAGADLANMVIGPGEPVLRRREGGDMILAELGPTASGLAGALDGERSLGAIGDEAGLVPRNTQAIAVGLVLLGLAEPIAAPRLEEPTPEPFAPVLTDDTPPGIPLDPALDTLRGVRLSDVAPPAPNVDAQNEPVEVQSSAPMDRTPPSIPLDPSLDTLRDVRFDDAGDVAGEDEPPVESTKVFTPEPLALDFSSGPAPVVKTAVGISTAQLYRDRPAVPVPPSVDVTIAPDAETRPMRVPVSAPTPPATPRPEPSPPRRPPEPTLASPPPTSPPDPRFDTFEQGPGERYLRRPSGLFTLGRPPKRSALPALAMVGVVLGAIAVALWLWLNISPRDAAPVTTVETPAPAPSVDAATEPAAEVPPPPEEHVRSGPAPTPPPASRRSNASTPPPQRTRSLDAGYENAAVRLRRGDVEGAAQGFAAALPSKGYTVQLLVACSPETAIKAAGQVQSADLFVVPLRFQGRDCYRLLYGRYASEGEARQALEESVPAYFKQAPSRPRIENLAALAR